jgi:hypothetical protein
MTVTNDKALAINGVDEQLETIITDLWGIENVYTFSFWIKPSQFFPEPLSGDHRCLAHLRGTTRRGEILVWGARIEGAKYEEEIYVELYDSLGQRARIFRFNTVQKRNEWRHFSFTWDGTSLIGYDQGSPVQDVAVVFSGGDNVLTSPAEGRRFRVGSLIEDTGPLLAGWSGTIGHTAVWNTPLAPEELGVVVSGGFGLNLQANSGAYVSSANLAHWYKPGDNFPDVGQDYAGAISLTSGTNATATGINNVITDFPS